MCPAGSKTLPSEISSHYLDLYLLRIVVFWEEPNVMKSGHHLAGVALHSGEVANLASSVSTGELTQK